MIALLDTGFLLAVLDSASRQHDVCRAILKKERQLALPDVVLPELAYML
jgi:predicted nucleic acid-binding protein